MAPIAAAGIRTNPKSKLMAKIKKIKIKIKEKNVGAGCLKKVGGRGSFAIGGREPCTVLYLILCIYMYIYITEPFFFFFFFFSFVGRQAGRQALYLDTYDMMHR